MLSNKLFIVATYGSLLLFAGTHSSATPPLDDVPGTGRDEGLIFVSSLEPDAAISDTGERQASESSAATAGDLFSRPVACSTLEQRAASTPNCGKGWKVCGNICCPDLKRTCCCVNNDDRTKYCCRDLIGDGNCSYTCWNSPRC